MMHVITLDYVMPLSVSEYVICIKPRFFFFFAIKQLFAAGLLKARPGSDLRRLPGLTSSVGMLYVKYRKLYILYVNFHWY